MNKNYETWVCFDNQGWVISKEHNTADDVMSEMLEKYTVEEMKDNGFTIVKVISDGKCWLEAIEEYDYT